jgi:fructose-1,6-bisphosphatase/inositol monophosphatase family enzyme
MVYASDFFLEITPLVCQLGNMLREQQKFAQGTNKNEAGFSAQAGTNLEVVTQVQFMKSLIKNAMSRHFFFNGEEDNDEIRELKKKFNPKSKNGVGVDPVDCTLNYLAGFDFYSINIGFFCNGILKGDLVHTPADRRMYCAVNNKGKAGTWTGNQEGKTDFVISPKNGTILSTGYCPQQQTDPLRRCEFIIYEMDIEEKYNYEYGICSLLRGELAGYLRYKTSALDWGLIAFIACKGGAIVTDFTGNIKNLHHYFGRQDSIEDGHSHSILAAFKESNHNVSKSHLGGFDINRPHRCARE